jgi:catechol 2,3-dioxygenase-like lactoylglutathione lyase family enzyme
MSGWYARPVLFSSDVEASLDFYTSVLGFTRAWVHDSDGKPLVAQVNRADCEIILAANAPRGQSRLFIELTAEELSAFQKEIETRSIPFERSWWGYPVIKIMDPDENELLFPIEDNG